MMAIIRSNSLTLILGLLLTTKLFAQTTNSACNVTPPTYNSCQNTAGMIDFISAPDNLQMTSGIYYLNVTGNYNIQKNATLNGGTLIVCGGTVNNMERINFNNGTLIISPSATVNHANSLQINGSTGAVYNYGTLRVNGTLTVQGSTLYNSETGYISTKNMEVDKNVRNLGAIDVTERLHIKGTGAVCMGNGAIISTREVYNDSHNSIAVPTGAACFSYKTTLGGNRAITGTDKLYICRAAGSSAPANIGSTTVAGNGRVISNCTNCAMPLNTELLSFELNNAVKGEISIDFNMNIDRDVKEIVLEHATFTGEFNEISIFKQWDQEADEIPFSYKHDDYRIGTNYYRLVVVKDDGTRQTLITKSIKIVASGDFFIYPNPANSGQEVTIQHQVNADQYTEVEVYSIVGRHISTIKLERGKLFHAMEFPKGQLILKFVTNGELMETVPLIVN